MVTDAQDLPPMHSSSLTTHTHVTHTSHMSHTHHTHPTHTSHTHVQVVFTPHSDGSYEAVLQVRAQLVGVEGDGDDASLTSRVILKALAEKPRLEVRGRGRRREG